MTALEKLLREAREDLGRREAAETDWRAVDSALCARLERERQAERARFAMASGRGWAVAGVALAAAAALIVVFAGKGHEAALPVAISVSADESAGNVVSVDGLGAVLVSGNPATPGTALRLGDEIDARGAKVVIDRPGKLTLLLERGSRARVTHVQGTLARALERGAVQAQVVPVPSGAAFAVDVAGSRVAVHGTHLRVERAEQRVVRDLSEGGVSLVEGPRAA